MDYIRKLLNAELIERLLFSAIVGGIVLIAGAGFRYLDLSNQLAANMAAQIHDEGSDVELESKSQAQGLMAADIERRRMVSERYNMMVVGGGGLALLGLGWLGYDIMRGRRRKNELPDDENAASAS